MKTIIFVMFFVVFGVLSLEAIEWTKMMQRQDAAQSWNNEEAAYQATGVFNTTLFVTLSDRDPVSCDALVSSTANDRVLAAQLAEMGFTEIQCMDRTARLGQ